MKKLFFIFGVIVGIYALIQLIGGSADVYGGTYKTGYQGGQIFGLLFGLACAWRLYKGE